MLKIIAAAVLLMWGLVSEACADPTTCTVRNSVPASVSEIATHPESYRSQCVVTRGVMRSVILFANVDGIYVQPPDSSNPASSGLRLGLDNFKEQHVDRYRNVEIIGRVQDCGSVRDAFHASTPEGEVVVITGYCHSFSGPYLWIYNLRDIRGPRIERRLQNFGRKDYGDLKPAPEGWAHRAEAEALAGQFLEALRSRDRETLMRLHFPDNDRRRPDDERELLDFLLGTHSPFEVLNSEHVILFDGITYDDPTEYRATACFCRVGSCSGRWPIASFDADNLPDRPYACSKIQTNLVDGKYTQAFETPEETVGLAEPR